MARNPEIQDRRKRDLRDARVAGFLSGLGIKPRRVRTHLERMDAALEAVSETSS